MTRRVFLHLFLLCLLLTACKEETYVYPDVLTEFIDLQTDESGTITRLITDNGKHYAVQPREGLNGLHADTIYRTVSIYQPLSEGEKPEAKLIVEVKRKDQPHTFHFIEDSISTDTQGIRTLYLRLYHNSKQDYEAFTDLTYLSVPLQHYRDTLCTGDKIRFRIHTYKEGQTYREFTY